MSNVYGQTCLSRHQSYQYQEHMHLGIFTQTNQSHGYIRKADFVLIICGLCICGVQIAFCITASANTNIEHWDKDADALVARMGLGMQAGNFFIKFCFLLTEEERGCNGLNIWGWRYLHLSQFTIARWWLHNCEAGKRLARILQIAYCSIAYCKSYIAVLQIAYSNVANCKTHIAVL